MKRLFLIFLVLALLVLIPFILLGTQFAGWMEPEKMARWFQDQKSWAWASGIGLLILDLFLPVLGTVVMSALGLVYGSLLGGFLAATGSIASGLLAYGLCRGSGRNMAVRLAGEKGLAEGERLFSGKWGGWIIAVSRWMPVLQEVMACMAGLGRMPFPKFLGALASGSIPLGFTYAWIGAQGVDQPMLALGLSAALPAVIWVVLNSLFFRRIE